MAMNRRILIQVTAPAVVIGLLLIAVCIITAWYVNRLQANLTNILEINVSSVQAAQQLENSVRQLRFHSFLYLIDPDPALLKDIRADEQLFEGGLDRAEQVAMTIGENRAVAAIKQGFGRYRRELEQLRDEVERIGPRKDVRKLRDAHPIRHVTDPCREYARLNEVMIAQTSQESHRVGQWLHFTMFVLSVGGPLAGLLCGYGIARGLSQSLYRLSVRVQDMAQHLEEDVAALKLSPDGDMAILDRQLEHVVGRVAEVTQKLQRHQRDMLRAQQLAAVGQLAASVAHEVRNPLTSIKMLVEAGLRFPKPRPFTSENLKVVHGEVLRLEQTVQSFLDFARPPALQRCACDIRSVVTQAVELVRARARLQKVAVEVCCQQQPVMGQVDRGQLCTVLVNLFINALDAMPGGGRLEVSLSAAPAMGITLRVLDTGEGIRPEMFEQLFIPFASSKPTGCGLGLSICKRIVEEHHGTINAATRPEGGACFTVTFPPTASEDYHANAPGD